MGDETSQGLTLQVLYNLIRESDRTGDPARQDTLPHPDAETNTDPNQNGVREDLEGDRTIERAQDLLYRLEIESHRIEQVTRNLQNHSSQHHTTQGMGMRILQDLTPREFTLDVRTLETRDLKWSHPISGTHFDTLPDPVEKTVNLTFWHCLKAAWHTQEVTISAPSSGNITELSQMLLWNRPYAAMKSFLHRMSAFHETRGLRTMIPLHTTIRALGLIAQKPKIHLLLPDWEAGHSDLNPRLGHSLEERMFDQDQMKAVENRTSAWNHDGCGNLGRLGNQILGGHKLAIQPASPIPPTRVYVTIIDHYMNLHTPWFRNTQILTHRLRILGNPRSKSIVLQIPMRPGQTCLEAILLTLQIVGCQQGNMQIESEGIQVFTTNHIPKGGPRHLEPTWSEHTGLLLLHHHSTLELSDRLTMFLPEEKNTITWGSACLAEDIEIRLADGTFATLQDSTGKAIWTDQQETRKIKRIHKFDTLETDPPLYGIGGNWMTESHFIWGRPESKWHRAFEVRGINKVKKKPPKGLVFAVELDTDDYLTLRGGIKAATFGNRLMVEPRRQGYTQDFRFKMNQALRRSAYRKHTS